MTEPLPNARITATEIFIDGTKLPGLIVAGSVIVRPAGHQDVNRIAVEFFVGKVEIEEP